MVYQINFKTAPENKTLAKAAKQLKVARISDEGGQPKDVAHPTTGEGPGRAPTGVLNLSTPVLTL